MTVSVKIIDRAPLYRLMKGSEHIKLSQSDLEKFDAMCSISSDIYAGFVNNELACVWGLVPPSMMSNTAYLWLYASRLVEENKFLFVRHSQRWIEYVLEQYDHLVGFCDPDNKQAIRWIQWLGGEFKPVADGRKDFVIRKRHGRSVHVSCG